MASSTDAMTANPLKRKRETKGKTRIVVALHSKPPDYVPGTGPKLQRIGLLPPRDSTAYIIERILLPSPGAAADGKPLPKRMTYIVGWHDLPAARLLVPAMRVLDYVSPLALEEWEYEMELELDEERAELEAEKTQKKPQKKGRGRPPANSRIEAATVAAPENEAMKTGRPQTGAMSLSTPTKTRLRDFEGLSDESSPSRQLERENSGALMQVDAEDDSDQVEMVTFQDDFQDLRDNAPVVASKSTTESVAEGDVRAVCDHLPFSVTGIASVRPTPKMPVPASKPYFARKETPVPLPRIPTIQGVQNGFAPVVERRTSFTPLGGTSSFSTSGIQTPDPLSETPPAASATQSQQKTKSKESAKKQKKLSKPQNPNSDPKPDPPQSNGEPVWEVKRVEATEMYEVEGVGLVRYFQVLWEGDWPPEQNPSWEPEANLPPTLVRNFLNKTKKKPAKKAPLKQSTLSWVAGKQYSSVSEAFADGEEDELLGPDVTAAPDEDADDNGEELFVVEEPPAKKSRGRGTVGWHGNGTGNREFGMLPAYQ
ncbi:hypothetical protein AK830_g1241 [Neonectria ditissima]|uniref:Chromo domain-containing protein n=1 Tax=Neonectria ditissima TaxID=78410 RepID=A0A0P7C0E9_9HYPO|nr:hypothetical protein AK830_g1241 [Neonectria ditissima]